MNSRKCGGLVRFGCLMLAGAVGLSVPALAQVKTSSGPALVFILAGASNAGGAGAKWQEIDPAERALLEQWVSQTKFMDNKRFDAAGNPVFEFTAPLPWARGTNGKKSSFGAEMGYAEQMEKKTPAENVYILKYTEGGSKIDQWNGELWPGFVAFLELGLSKIDEPYQIMGFTWMQESDDAKVEEDALTYKDDTRFFLERVRAQVNAPDMAIALVQEPNEGGQTEACLQAKAGRNPYLHIIHGAKLSLVEEMSNVSYVDTSTFTYADDCVHFDTASQLKLGRTLGDMQTALQKRRARKGS